MADEQQSAPGEVKAPTAAPKVAKVVREVPSLHAMRCSLAEHRRNIWHIEVDVGVEPDEMIAPGYWAHISANLRQGDRIEAHAEDGAWFAEFLVQDSGANWAKVAVLRAVKLQGVNPERRGVLLPGHTVTYAGTFAKWRVVRDVDKRVLKDKCGTEGEAYAWLSNYAKTVTTT